ncbi:MAG: hypothetical protein KKA19_03015, partial [Candidatus Margulisbacteria bacterium]|nr:hypothetical protein [Candidatus Margulisiibacteriota bacterium]
RKEAEWQEYKNHLNNNTLNYAFFGDSHTLNGLNPKYLNNSFNFGFPGEEYTETYYKIRKIIEKDQVEIKNLILEVDIHTFSDFIRTDDALFGYLGYYNNFMSINKIAELKKQNIIILFLRSKLRIVGNGMEIMSYFMVEPIQFKLGWVNLTGDFSVVNRTSLTSIRYKKYFSNNPNLIEKRSFDYFIKTLKFAKKNKMNVIFIKYPISYEFHSELEKNNISEKQYYSALFDRVNKTILDYNILDYYDLFFEHPEYFADPDHLNWQGSEIITKKIVSELYNLRNNDPPYNQTIANIPKWCYPRLDKIILSNFCVLN